MPREIRLSLVQADALTIPCDVAVLGSRSPLRARLERAARNRFRYLRYGDILGRPLCEADLLTSDQLAWANVLSLPYNSRRQVSDRQMSKVAGALLCAHNLFRPSRVLLLPLSWRNPEAVAICLLAAVYSAHYYSHLSDTTRQGLDEAHYAICDQAGVEPFARALDQDALAVRQWFERVLAPFAGFFVGRMDFSRVVFRQVPLWETAAGAARSPADTPG